MSSIVELAVGVILAAAATYFVLRPVLVPRPPEPVADEAIDPDDDLSPRAVALRALKEIEFDRATGKLTDVDYDTLKRRYTAEAVQALRSEESTTVPVTPITPRAPTPPSIAPACSVHGKRPERDARYCSECGRRLEIAAGFCSRCGTPMEPGARFCSSCGRRVAA